MTRRPAKEKVLYAHNGDFSSTGANKIQVACMCAALQAEGTPVTLLAFSDGPVHPSNRIAEGVTTDLLRSKAPYPFRSLRLFMRFLRRHRRARRLVTRDLLLAYLVSTWSANTEVVYELHDLSKGMFWRALFRKAFPKLHRLVVITDGLKQELVGQGFPPAAIAVLPDGADIASFDLSLTRAEARRRLGLPASKGIALYTGSFKGWKGCDTFREAARHRHEALFLLVGAQTPEELHLGAGPNVQIRPFADRELVPAYLKAADVLILPNSAKERISARYTSPLKLFEYLAAKRPVVASDLPSIREVVSDQDVLFVRPDDPAALAEAIGRILANKRLAARLTRNGFRTARRYDWRMRAKRLDALFRQRA